MRARGTAPVRWALLLALAVIGSACSAIHRGAGSETVSRVSAADAEPSLQHEDSLEVIDSELAAAGDSPDAIGEALAVLKAGEEIATESRRKNARTEPGERRRPALAIPLTLDITAIRGYRSEYRAAAGLGRSLSAGIKSDDIGPVGYLHYRGSGVIRMLHVGNLRVRVGERLILGRSLGTYPPPTVTPVRGGAAISPSLSRWFGRPGAALAVGVGGFRGQAVLVAAPGPAFETRAAWLFMTHVGETASLGIALGREIRAVPDAPVPAPGLTPSVAALHGSFLAGPVRTSLECVAYPKTVPFFAVRTAYKRHSTVSLLLFRAPTFPGGANPIADPAPNDRTVSGAGLIARHRHRGARVRLSFLSGTVASPEERRPYRRILLTVSGGDRRHTSWETSFYWRAETNRDYPDDAVDIGSDTHRREGRLRLGLRVAPDRGLAYRFHLDLLPGLNGGKSGAALSISTSLTARRIALQWRVSAYSLPAGRRGYITRPGAGYFESFSTVFGSGSDVSARLRWRFRELLSIFAYYGTPWSKAGRAYVGAEFHFGR